MIVGRCGDYVLEQTGVPHLSIFITAPFDDRVSREMKRHQLSEKDAVALVKKMDKQRRSYYNYYTDRTWGDPHNYDPVSYTHLDVYKRQSPGCSEPAFFLLRQSGRRQGAGIRHR